MGPWPAGSEQGALERRRLGVRATGGAAERGLDLAATMQARRIALRQGRLATCGPNAQARGLRVLDVYRPTVLAIGDDGQIWGWGVNARGELGLGDRELRATPCRLPDGGPWSSVACGLGFSVGVKADGTLWFWGDEASYLFFNDAPAPLAPQQVGDENAWELATASEDRCYLLRRDGALWSGGWRSSILGAVFARRRMEPVGLGEDWQMVSCAGGQALALRRDGSLWAWVSTIERDEGAAEAGDREIREGLQQVGDERWLTAAGGGGYSLALRRDGSLWAWGVYTEGRLGLGDCQDRFAPSRVGHDNDWRLLAAGSGHGAALKEDGSLWTWGSNAMGQLGLGDSAKRDSPCRVDDSRDWETVACGTYHTAALRRDGSVWIWGCLGRRAQIAWIHGVFGTEDDGLAVMRRAGLEGDVAQPRQIGSLTS